MPQKVTQSTVKKIQDQYANIVLDRDNENILIANKLDRERPVVPQEEIDKVQQRQSLVKQKQVRVSETQSASTGEYGKPGASSSEESGSPLTSRQQMRQQIDQQVETQGILGILSSTSSKANNNGAGDILDPGNSVSQDYDQIFKNIDKLSASGGDVKGKGGGGSGTRTAARGQRTTQGSGIGNMISNLGTTTTKNMERTSDFIVSTLAPISDDGKDIERGAVSSGARDLDKVNSIVQAHSPAIQYCYEREVRRDPDLKGKVVVRFTIVPNGSVKNAKIISSTLKSQSVERCILSRISRWDDFGAIDSSLGNATFRQVYTFGF